MKARKSVFASHVQFCCRQVCWYQMGKSVLPEDIHDHELTLNLPHKDLHPDSMRLIPTNHICTYKKLFKEGFMQGYATESIRSSFRALHW